MSETQIRLAFDYVDPGSYLVERLIERWIASTGLDPVLERFPLELRPASSAPIDPADPEWSAMTEAIAEEAGRFDIPFRVPGFVPRTRKAHELALHARERGCFPQVHGAIFEAHFVRGEDLGRVDVLVRIAEREGLDPGETRTVLGVDRFLPHVLDLRRRGLEAGFGGVPILEGGGRRMEGYGGEAALLSFLTGSAGGPDADSTERRRSE